MKVKKYFISLLVLAVLLSLLSFSTFTGCKRARLKAMLENQNQEESEDTGNLEDEDNAGSDEKTQDSADLQENSSKGSEVDDGLSGENQSEDDGAESSQGEQSAESSEGEENNDADDVEEATDEAGEDTSGQEQEDTEEETSAAETVEYTEDMQYNNGGSSMEGSPNYTGAVGAGDITGREVKGFISFYIGNLAGSTIKSAKISATADNISGTPFKTYGPLIIKAIYWGNGDITEEAFNLDGVEIANSELKNFGFKNSILKNELQKAVDLGQQEFQFVFYFEMDGVNDDSSDDAVIYMSNMIKLTVTYAR
ncbi:MAG: hypothetical protein FJW66_01110 [Actinobacteria bacterium]|nr:hypothetical protein [Actinomycetota bacterium]